MEKALKLYNSKGAFPSDGDQIEILGFNYDAKRMGGAPIITGTVMYGSCLDSVWTDDVYVEFKGEKYYLKQTPTSSKSNSDARYKHECEFVSERIKLDNVYFIDAVVGNPQGSDAVATNSATFSFFGTILEFAKRLNAGLQYSKLQSVNESGEINGYYVEIGNLVDKDGKELDKEEKLLSFDKVPFSVALQESYNQFGIPYYFEGKKIVFGFYEHAINNVFKYGADKSLLSITKNNANQKIINRCTGVGSEENIPYYYPNEHPLGLVDTYYTPNGGNKELRNDLVVNENKFAEQVKKSTELTYSIREMDNFVLSVEQYSYGQFLDGYGMEEKPEIINTSTWFVYPLTSERAIYGAYKSYNAETDTLRFSRPVSNVQKCPGAKHALIYKIDLTKLEKNDVLLTTHSIDDSPVLGIKIQETAYIMLPRPTGFGITKLDSTKYVNADDLLDEYNQLTWAYYCLELTFNYNIFYSLLSIPIHVKSKMKLEVPKYEHFWENEKGKRVELDNYGLKYDGQSQDGDKITIQVRESSLLPYQNALMPPIYIETGGEERFYNALDDTYKDENGNYYKFFNTYSDSKRKEHIVDFPDIKPSINNVKNAKGEYINSFIDIKFDDNDSDETYEEEGGGSLKYLHPYFYVKLRKFDGEYGFNLFDHASEQGEMTISMTSGHCGACNFVIGVDENTKKNILQVDDNGDLVWDSKKGMPTFGDPQDRQNDTRNNEVWLALKKDIETYNHIMPSGNLKPAISDTFVITNISFPKVYLRHAEERLKEEIIRFMYENNVEKFTFSIKFSRIYLEENPEVLALLNENSLINIEYNGEKKTLYVNSFSYKKDASVALPEINVELVETLSASQNALQTAISEVKADVLSRVQKMDIAAMVASKFISKENEDQALQRISFNRGLAIGTVDETIAKIDEDGNADLISQIIRQYISTPHFIDGFAGTGFKLWLDENGKSNLTIDNLTTRETFKVFEMLVTKLRAVNGGLFVSAANGTIKDVRETEDGLYYDIILENDNTFVAGDYMRCQVMSGLKIMDYWVEIYSTNGRTCRVLKSEFGVATPLVGQDVVLDGSKNKGRQNAIHISATEDGQPRIDIFNGIATKSHDNCLRARLGNLDGIYDELFGENQPKGDGLYSDNAYLKGEFIVKSRNESVDTMFAVQEGKIKSLVGQTQTLAAQGGFLRNPSFAEGLKYWQTNNQATTVFSLRKPVFTNGEMLVDGIDDNVRGKYDEEKFFVTLKNGFIKQLNDYFVNKPTFEDFKGKKIPVNVSFKIRVKAEGKLTVKVGDNIIIDEIREATKNFIEVKGAGEWVGNEHFTLNFSGEADLTDLSLYTDELAYKTETLIEQTDKYVNILAKNFDEEGNVKSESGLMVKPNEAGLYAQGENREQTKIAAYEDGKILLKGDNIQLEGDVTANGKVRIRKDGTLEAFNGVFTGVIRNGFVTITKENFYTYFEKVTVTEPTKTTFYRLVDDAFYSKIKIKSIPDDVNFLNIFLPTYNYYPNNVWGDLGYVRIDLDSARELIGTSFFLYNELEEKEISVYRMRPPKVGETSWMLTGLGISDNHFAAFEYKCFAEDIKNEQGGSYYREAMFWDNIIESTFTYK